MKGLPSQWAAALAVFLGLCHSIARICESLGFCLQTAQRPYRDRRKNGQIPETVERGFYLETPFQRSLGSAHFFRRSLYSLCTVCGQNPSDFSIFVFNVEEVIGRLILNRIVLARGLKRLLLACAQLLQISMNHAIRSCRQMHMVFDAGVQ